MTVLKWSTEYAPFYWAALWLDQQGSASSYHWALWRVPLVGAHGCPQRSTHLPDLTLLPRWGCGTDPWRNTKCDHWKRGRVARIKVKMEEDPCHAFNCLSLKVLISEHSFMLFLEKKNPLDLCIYCQSTGKPNRPWILPLSNSVLESQRPGQWARLVLGAELAGPRCLGIWSNIILMFLWECFGWN